MTRDERITRWASFLAGWAVLLLALFTGNLMLSVIAAGLIVMPTVLGEGTEKSEPINAYPTHLSWAQEAVRHLPGAERAAHGLEQMVRNTGGFDKIEAPWDPSTVEEVERILEEAAKPPPQTHWSDIPRTNKIMAQKIEGIRATTIDDVQGEFGTQEWMTNRLAQLTHGKPVKFSDRVVLPGQKLSKREATLLRREFQRKYSGPHSTHAVSGGALDVGISQFNRKHKLAILAEGGKPEHVMTNAETARRIRALKLRQRELTATLDKPQPTKPKPGGSERC